MSTIEQRLELLTLKQVFAKGKRSFSIPAYQRGYSWEEDQRKDLIKDIEYGMDGGYSHYTGTLVAVKKDSIQDNDHFEIVDGQQRLATLIILLSCMAHVCERRNIPEPEDLRRYFLEEGSEHGNTCRKFALSNEQDNLFWDMVKEPDSDSSGKVKNKGHQNIVDAFDQFKKWLQPKNGTSLSKIYEYITNQLGFLMYAPNNTREIGIMFEVINNRGKPLSELEKVKNYLMYYSEKNDIQDLKKAVDDKWPEILEHLNRCNHTSNDDENGFLRNCWIVFQDATKNKSFYVYDNLKDQFPTTGNDRKRLEDFVAFLEKSALTYQKLYTREGVTEDKEKECLTRLGHQPVLASVLPLILAIFNRETEASTRVPLLELVEKLNFRFYGTGIASRTDSGQGELFKLAHDFYNHHSKTRDDVLINASWLEERLREFVNNNAKDKNLIKNLTLDIDESGDYYHWSWLKYFLASYEGNLERKEGREEKLEQYLAERDPQHPNDFYHLEHIWAVADTKRINDKGNLDRNKRRLGNFILLKESINLSMGKKSPEEKVPEYFRNTEKVPDTRMIRELKDLFDQAQEEIENNEQRKNKTWKYWYLVYARFLDLHEERYVNFALERWRVEGIKNPVDKRVTLNSLSGSNEIFKY